MRHIWTAGAVAVLSIATAAFSAQTEPASTRDAHIAAARAAAGSDHVAVFDRLCTATPPPETGPAGQAARSAPAAGASGPLAVARRAREGVRQSLFRRPDRVLGLGRDHLGRHHPHRHDLRLLGRRRGCRRAEEARARSGHDQVRRSSATATAITRAARNILQDHFGTRVILSAADWDLLDRSSGTKPKRDMVATDGQKLTLGDTTLTLYLTPGHTLGTISTLIPVKDSGRRTSSPRGAGRRSTGSATGRHTSRQSGRTGSGSRPTVNRRAASATSCEGRRRRAHLEPHDLRRIEDEAAGRRGAQAGRPASVRHRRRPRPAVSDDGRRMRAGRVCNIGRNTPGEWAVTSSTVFITASTRARWALVRHGRNNYTTYMPEQPDRREASHAAGRTTH